MYFMDPCDERKGPRGKLVMGRGRKKGTSCEPVMARRKLGSEGDKGAGVEVEGEASKREER